jgi:putative transposase
MSNLGIEPGLNNWLTCIRNVGTSLIVDGLHLKSLNQFYNKQIANIKENKAQRLFGEKTEGWKESNWRIKRDLYQSMQMRIDHRTF